MSTRRGPNNSERFGLDASCVTADASLVEAPCFVYQIVAGLIDTSATGEVVLADSSASGAGGDKETAKIEIKLNGAGGGSANSAVAVQTLTLAKPWYVQKTLVADITNATVSVLFHAAS